MAKYNHIEVEKVYRENWDKKQTYAYEKSSQKDLFVIDTPPPTVSGYLHIGHIFSYTQTDILARFHRMMGKNVFYPMGWDDNGLPTEKRVQSLYAVKCDPRLDYNPALKIEKKDKKNMAYTAISRKNFTDLCDKQILEDEKKYKELWSYIGLSVDWNQTYRTIDPYTQVLSQLSFLDLYRKKLVEYRDSPVLWDTQFQTAVAQADIEDRKQSGFYYDIQFKLESGENLTISTTRPELLPACVALAAHPEDERYRKFFGKKALSPLFSRSVPVTPSSHADPEKGTGILMICTFGDMEDVLFCKKNHCPVLEIINDEGCFTDISFGQGYFKSQNPKEADFYYSALKGLRVKPARKKIVEILKAKKHIPFEPKACQQYVKFYEKGDFPLEIRLKRQWYIKLLDYKEEFLKQGRKIQWHPQSMRKRYEQWVEGLNQDWCISRQRSYGIPFPLWYKKDREGKIDYNHVFLPFKDRLSDPDSFKNILLKYKNKFLPVDPLKSVPEGFQEHQRDQADGFVADTNVMDTWATSSLSPYINSAWLFNPVKHKKFFPADLRPQGHEIIRTWAFYTIVKSYFHEKKTPWKNIAVSGWVVTPDRIKMSKSKGNALSPENLIKTYSADAVRYWSAKARLGQDSVYDENLFKVGKRLVTKIFNAGHFVQIQLEKVDFKGLEGLQNITEPLDQSWVKKLFNIQIQVINLLENYNYSGALDEIEKNFWFFCDNYLELIKARTYQFKNQPEGFSGQIALDYSLYVFLKLFAPYLPYITESVWSKRYRSESPSVHKALWTDPEDLNGMLVDKSLLAESQHTSLLENASFILEQVRSQKTHSKKSLATPLKSLELKACKDFLKEFKLYKGDFLRASCALEKDCVFIEENHLKKPKVKIKL